MTRSRSLQVLALAAVSILLVSCEPESLKEIIEDKFPGFTGLGTPPAQNSIVGLTPAPGFSNLHCCWVGDRTEWKEIFGSWSTEKKTATNAAITGIIKAVGLEIDADSVSYVEAKAEPFYRQQLVNIRHIERDHCSAHDHICSKTLCTDSLKAGKMSVYTYTEWKGAVGIAGNEVATVKIGNEEYEKEVQNSTDIIVGYKMTTMSCGKDGVYFGDDHTPSAGLRAGETYEEHELKRLAESPEADTASSDPLRLPSIVGTVTMPPEAAASVITPPPDGVIGGQVIRVSTADDDGRPVQTLTGIVVTETDESGSTSTRDVSTDSIGGAWIPIDVTTTLVTISHDGKEVFRAEPREPVGFVDESPVIEQITPHVGEAPPGIVQSGTLIDISGHDFGTVTQVHVNDEPVNVAASGGDTVVAEFDIVGLAHVAVAGVDGLGSIPFPIEGVSIVVEAAPPPTMMKGQDSSAWVPLITTSQRELIRRTGL